MKKPRWDIVLKNDGISCQKTEYCIVIAAFYCVFASHKLHFNQHIITNLSQIPIAQAETNTDRQIQVNARTIVKLPTLLVHKGRKDARYEPIKTEEVINNKYPTHPRILPILTATTTKTTTTKIPIQTAITQV